MIKNIDLGKTVEESFTRYAGNVILDRAICDVRDMIKPSTRMLLYSQRKITKSNASKPFIKSARVVGDVLGHLYEHGESSAYQNYIRLSQPFAMRYPLEECQGNNGTVVANGDYAAMRYTELRPSALCEYLFDGINSNAITEWKDNFDNTEQYPNILPSIGFYNICNGTIGLGIAISSSIPSFNLTETNKAIIKLIRDENVSDNEIICYPDFPTGGMLMNMAEVKDSLLNGSGKSCRVRAILDYNAKDNSFVIKELPYGVFTEVITSEIKALLEKDPNYGIDSINDGSGSIVDYHIYLAKDVNPEIMKSKLYHDTSLESYFTINMTMLKDGKFPVVYTWRAALLDYIQHIRACKRRELEYENNKLLARNHLLEGLLIAIANIDDVIKLIKSSKNSSEAKANLISKYNLDSEQAQAILDIKLQRLAHMESIEIDSEYKNNASIISTNTDILSNKTKLDNVLIEKLEEVITKFGDSRRTHLYNSMTEDEEEASGEVYVKLNNSTIEISPKQTKTTKTVMVMDTLIGISKDGSIYKSSIRNIMNSGKKTNSFKSVFGADIINVFLLSDVIKCQYLLIATQKYCKRVNMSEYNFIAANKRSRITKLNDNDTIAIIMPLDASKNYVINGNLSENDIPIAGRNARGKTLKIEAIVKHD